MHYGSYATSEQVSIFSEVDLYSCQGAHTHFYSREIYIVHRHAIPGVVKHVHQQWYHYVVSKMKLQNYLLSAFGTNKKRN